MESGHCSGSVDLSNSWIDIQGDPMKMDGTLILTRSEIANLMKFADYIEAVEQAFLLLASGKILGAGILDLPGEKGMFHIKGSAMPIGEDIYVGIKANGNFPENKSRFRLPTIQGAILLCDGIRGYPLAFLDSIEITINRTGAATAIAAKYLARKDSSVATICGCGKQGRIQLIALKEVLPIIKAFTFDKEESLSERFAAEMSDELGIRVIPIKDLHDGTQQSDVIVTCTTSRQFFLRKEHVANGAFIAAVGADSHDKQEIEPMLLASSKVVTDVLDQCARIGDLHHAIQANLMTKENVYADLHEIVGGSKFGRSNENEITIFDSTGTAIQDVATAAIAYQRAIQQGVGRFINVIGG
jgi:alanine dehydrogenase